MATVQEEILRILMEVKGEADLEEAIRKIRTLTEEMGKAEKATGGVTAESRRARQGILDISRAAQDWAQGGFPAILNNLEGLGRAIPALLANPLAMFTSLPALLTLAGVAIYEFGDKIQYVIDRLSYSKDSIKLFKDEVETLKEKIKGLEKTTKLPFDYTDLQNAKQALDELETARKKAEEDRKSRTAEAKKTGAVVGEVLEEYDPGAVRRQQMAETLAAKLAAEELMKRPRGDYAAAQKRLADYERKLKEDEEQGIAIGNTELNILERHQKEVAKFNEAFAKKARDIMDLAVKRAEGGDLDQIQQLLSRFDELGFPKLADKVMERILKQRDDTVRATEKLMRGITQATDDLTKSVAAATEEHVTISPETQRAIAQADMQRTFAKEKAEEALRKAQEAREGRPDTGLNEAIKDAQQAASEASEATSRGKALLARDVQRAHELNTAKRKAEADETRRLHDEKAAQDSLEAAEETARHLGIQAQRAVHGERDAMADPAVQAADAKVKQSVEAVQKAVENARQMAQAGADKEVMADVRHDIARLATRAQEEIQALRDVISDVNRAKVEAKRKLNEAEREAKKEEREAPKQEIAALARAIQAGQFGPGGTLFNEQQATEVAKKAINLNKHGMNAFLAVLRAGNEKLMLMQALIQGFGSVQEEARYQAEWARSMQNTLNGMRNTLNGRQQHYLRQSR